MSEKSLAIQQLDEALSSAGHDPECAAYEPGNPCSGPPVCHGEAVAGLPTVPRATPVSSIIGLTDYVPAGAVEMLHGTAAEKLRAYKAAATELKAAQSAAELAGAKFRKALEEFTAAVMAE